MTAIYGELIGGTVQLLTDGAVTDFDGILLSTKTKVRTSRLVPLAVTGRGGTEFLDAIVNCVVCYSNVYGFDATLTWLSETLSGMRDVFKAKGRLGEFDIVVAGLSESQGMGMWLISTHDLYAGEPGYGHGGFALAKMPSIGFGPLPPARVLAKVRADKSDPATLFKRHGAAFLTAARADRSTGFHSDFPQVSIGGHVDLTVITARGVTTERLVTWDDKIGERMQIKPPAKAYLLRRQKTTAAADSATCSSVS